MPPHHTNEEVFHASLQFRSRSIENASMGSLDEDDEQVLEGLLACAQDCREKAADVLNEIQVMVASEIDAWKNHRVSCSTLEQAGVPRAAECIDIEKKILQEYEKLQGQVVLCFRGIRAKTEEAKLLSPHEKQMAELLNKNQELERRLKEKEEQEAMLNDELARTSGVLARMNDEFARTSGDLAKTNDEFAKMKEALERRETEIAVLENEFGVSKEVHDNFAFGASAWNKYFGNVGEEPPLPWGIMNLLESPCPFWSGKKIRETHLLVLIPSTVDGQPFSLDLLATLIQNPKAGGNRTSYRFYQVEVKNGIGNKSVEKSHWILITREILPGSMLRTFEGQEALVASYNQSQTRTGVMEYNVSSAMEAATAVLIHYVRSGEILVGSDVSARCRDRISRQQSAVGYFDSTSGIQLWLACPEASPKQGVLGVCEWK